jgi:hypothetical protein
VRFLNKKSHPLSFELGGVKYAVPSADEGGFVEIPQKHAGPKGSFVTMRGLPLEPDLETEEAPAPVGPTDPEARLWHDRAHAMIADLNGASKKIDSLHDELAASEAKVVDLEAQLAAKGDDSALTDRVAELEAQLATVADPAPLHARIAELEGELKAAHELLDGEPKPEDAKPQG